MPYLRRGRIHYAKISGARKVPLGGAGHAANIEVAEAFNPAVREFLEEI